MSRWSKSILLYAAVFCAASYWTVRAEPAQSAATQAVQSGTTQAAQSGTTRNDTGDATFSRSTLDRYCVGCHNGRTRAGGLTLDSADPFHVAAAPRVWEKVVGKLRDRAMPPAGSPRPDAAAYDRLAYRGMHGGAEISRFLLAQGANANAVNKRGWTPLIIADGLYFSTYNTTNKTTADVLRAAGATEPPADRVTNTGIRSTEVWYAPGCEPATLGSEGKCQP
jgi:Planctomycete cytochrome C